MNGYSAAVATCLEQMAPPSTETAERDFSQSELVQDIARDLSATQKHQAGLDADISIGVLAEAVYESSEKCIDIASLFPKKLSKPREARYTFSVLQEWEGYVLSISEDTFTARLVDVTMGRSEEDEEADLPLDDLEDADRSRIRDGAIFRWTIGYQRGPGGTKYRSSCIVFRNLPGWTKKELEKNRREAADWASALSEE